MTQERTNKLVLLDFCRVPVCFTNCSWGLRLVNACMSFAPRVFYRVCSRVLCSYRTNHVVSAAMLLVLLLVGIIFLFFQNSSTLKVQRRRACRSGGSYAARAFRLFRLGPWTSWATLLPLQFV